MSRIGKNPVAIPAGTTVTVSGKTVVAKGKLGERRLKLVDEVDAVVEGDQLVLKPSADSSEARMMWGTYRALSQNLITGVSTGFTRNLEITGVGYRAGIEGKNLKLQLGFSHDVLYPIPDEITIRTERPTAIAVSGVDKQRVGQVAAEIRAYRPPEPYKGKGIKYSDEIVVRKEGKKK
jgi:large subunit ribosomal protein L6